MRQKLVLTSTLLVCAAIILGATGTSETTDTGSYDIGVFVPGVVDGSPTYEMLVDGVQRAVDEAENATIAVIEGGFNQSTWEEGVMSMAATGSYDLIVTSNPSMPEIAARVTEEIPSARFLVLDGYLEGSDRIHTILFNQREQAYICGFFAGLITTSDLPGVNADTRVGLLAGQEYPIMNEVILPAYRQGLQAGTSNGTVDFRVLGNWYDAGKAQEIVADMVAQGSDIILTIAGSGNQGTISAARERDVYVVWYDDSGYDQGPGVVIGSSFVRQDVATYEATKAAIEGALDFGTAQILGVSDGAVSFDTDHPGFTDYVPQPVREEITDLLQRMASGEIDLPMPTQ
jgi:basic membrane lipoprotein Med (substrate-binding protein (PBP1-ABC) superfamily)